MSRIEWDVEGEHFFETGVDHGVMYDYSAGAYGAAHVWNGLTAVNEQASGAERTPLYADNIKYLDLLSVEEYAITIEAYTYPEEFGECDGSAQLVAGVKLGQQPRKRFGFSWRTRIGNDLEGDALGYKIHLAYGCIASPSERSHATVNDSVEAMTLSWEVGTTPVNVTGHKPTASVEIDSTTITAGKLALIEAALYGAEEFSALKTYAVGDVVSHGTGEDAAIYVCSTAITTPGAWSESNWTENENIPAEPTLLLPDEIAALIAA